MKIESFFANNPVFRYEEFQNFMKNKGTISLNSCRKRLAYHVKTGHIIPIRRGLYASLSPTETPEKCLIDPYLIAAKATDDAVISHHTALELHGLAYTTFEHLTYLTAHRVAGFQFHGQVFQPVMFPKNLEVAGEINSGVVELIRQGIKIQLTNIERTIVDLLVRPDLAGGREEIWRSFENLLPLDTNFIVAYTLTLNNATTCAKVGFFLEQLSTSFQVDDKTLNQLEIHKPKVPHYMDRQHRQGGHHLKRWNLVVPITILEKKWEEPHEQDF